MLKSHQKSSRTSKKSKFLTLSFYCITLALICQAFLPVSGALAASSTNAFYFDNYEADYYLSKDADGRSKLRVVEEFTAVFPLKNQNHGITRVIPYTNQDGQNLTMASDKNLDIKIYHNDKLEQPYKIENGDGNFTVYIGDPDLYVNNEQTYRLEYEFQNVITEFTDDSRSWQELYWDTNGNDWSQRFNKVTATVHFDSADIADAYTGDAWCYVGTYSSNNQSRCKINRIDSKTIQFTTEKLSSRENLTFDIEFKPSTFVMPAKTYDYQILIIVIIELLIAAIVVAWIIYIIRKTSSKREYYKGLFIKPEYTPPTGFTVGEMAENYMKKSGLGSSKVATLMELAVTGKIELIKSSKKTRLGRTATVWKVRIKSVNLSSEQVIVLQIIAGQKRTINIGQEIEIKSHTADSELIKLSSDFNEQVQKTNKTKDLEVVKEKSKKAETSKSTGIITFLTIVCIASIFGLIWIIDELNPYRVVIGGVPLIVAAFVLPWVLLILTIIISAKFSPFFTYTEKGLEYSRYLDGLKLYIKMAEQERIDFLQSVKGADTSNQGIVKLYEKLLPYAIIFRQEKSWAKELSKYYEMKDVSTPAWYIGVGAFSAQDFSTAIIAASSTINSSIAHSTTSNSSSSFSGGGGGGFSGGGGGGGGGGGW